jgi:cleavage stimulation factor subunit 3
MKAGGAKQSSSSNHHQTSSPYSPSLSSLVPPHLLRLSFCSYTHVSYCLISIMAEYDPLDPPTFNAGDNDDDDSYDPAAIVNGNAAGDDDDEEEYEPDFGDATAQDSPAHDKASSTASAQPSQQVSRTPSAAPNVAEQTTKPKTVGGFILEESDDEEDSTPAPSQQLESMRGAQLGLGGEAQDLSLASEPTPDAVAASIAQQNNGLTGSTTLATSTTASVPAPVSSVTSDIPVPAVQVSAAAADQSNVLSPSVQPSAAHTPTSKPANGTAASQPPQSAPVPQRLAHDRVGQLEDRIKDDPKADTDAWMSLIAYYKEKDQPDNVRKVYERFLAVFPSAVCIFRTDYHDLAKCTH